MNEFGAVNDYRVRDEKCVQGFGKKKPNGKRQLGRLSLGWNETTELHLNGRGVRLLNALIWWWMETSALLNKIMKYTNQLTHAMKQSSS
jgi:hypothetical protein